MDGLSQGIEMMQFMLENTGAIATLLLVITLVPCVMVFVLYSILRKQFASSESQRKEYGQQIAKIGSSMAELIGVLNGLMSVWTGNISCVFKKMQDDNYNKEKEDKKK